MNTKYFHVVANQKGKKARIHRIQDSAINWLKSQNDMIATGVEFFQNQFGGSYCLTDCLLVSQLIPSLICIEVNASLTLVLGKGEVWQCILSMDQDSSVGSDGFRGSS